MKKLLLLTFGNESSIEITKSVSELNTWEIYGCHYDTLSPGRAYLNKNYIFECPNPFKESNKFLSWLNEFVSDRSIDAVCVTNCKMLKFVHSNWDSLKNTEVYMVPGVDGLEPCLYKDKLYKLLPDISPKVYTKEDIENIGWGIPLFAKPTHGSSGEGGRKGENNIDFWCTVNDEDVVTEFLPGEEYTVDCVSTKTGELVDWNVRERTRVRDGITSYGKSSNDRWQELGEHLKTIARELHLPYFWFAQFKCDASGVPKLLEINCRISGSFCITKNSRKDYIKFVFSGFDGSRIVKGPPGDGAQFSIARHMNTLPVGRKTWVWDIDGTICTETGGNYAAAAPLREAIATLNQLHDRGDEVVLHTARGMKRFNNDVGMVYSNLYQLTIHQLSEWGVRYDKLIMGKPYGIPVDTDAVTPSELEEVLLKN